MSTDMMGQAPQTKRKGRCTIDTVVIGGSQVGLTTGYYLKKQNRGFVILDASERIGDAWRNRWDSLTLFSPSRYNGLPGLRFPAPGSSYANKDQMADYLESYAKHFDLPVKLRSAVLNLSRTDERFVVETADTTYVANNVIVAIGSSQTPKIPAFADQLGPPIFQVHSKSYRNPSQLRPGRVLIVGAGNSGADIGLEVAQTHEVIWSGKETAAVPFRIETFIARHLLTRIVRFVGLYVISLKTPIGRKLRPKMLEVAAPLVRVKPKDLVNVGVKRVGRIAGVKDGLPVTEEGETLDVANVIWCTGFRPAFSWIDLPILAERGEPNHDRGVIASHPGLYFVGLHFQYALASETIPGHQRDAKYVADHLAKRSPVLQAAPSGV